MVIACLLLAYVYDKSNMSNLINTQHVKYVYTKMLLLGLPWCLAIFVSSKKKGKLALTSSFLLIYFPTMNALEIFCQLFGSQSVS
jgi:hypothetical protein